MRVRGQRGHYDKLRWKERSASVKGKIKEREGGKETRVYSAGDEGKSRAAEGSLEVM